MAKFGEYSPVSGGVMRFYVCELKSGVLIDEYPLEISQALSRRLKTYGAGEFQLPVLGLNEAQRRAWAEDIVPWRVLIVVCDDNDRIMWSGIPTGRSTDESPVVRFPCVTVEKYLDRRYMGDAEFEQEDQTASIARTLAESVGDDVVGIGLEYDTPPSGVLRDRAYFNDEDARVLARLQQLSNVINGFEWTIDVEWTDDERSRVRKVFRTGYPRMGYVTNEPEHVFSVVSGVPGPVSAFSHESQWGDGDAATLVQAVGDGQGEDKPYSAPMIDSAREAAGWPRLEERQSKQGVIEEDELETHVRGMAETYFGGQSVISFDALVSQWPSPADVSLGDSARLDIETDQLTISEVWRIVGYSISPDVGRWTPVIARVGDTEGLEDDDAG